MRSRTAGLIALALALLLAGCDSPTGSDSDSGLRVTGRAHTLRLTNATSEPVYWFAMEASTATLLDWWPCTDPARCPAISPGHTRVLPYDSIEGYSSDAEHVLVYWWHLVPHAERGFWPDSIRTVRADL